MWEISCFCLVFEHLQKLGKDTRLPETGTAKQVFATPLHPYTRALLDCIPVPGKTRHGAKLGSIPGMVPSLMGPLDTCQFYNRCTHAFAACSAGPVALRERAPDHGCRCLLDEAPRASVRSEPALGALR